MNVMYEGNVPSVDFYAFEFWLKSSTEANNMKAEDISFVFMTDDELLDINIKYLKHNYYTDIITFDNSDRAESLSADIFISVDRVRENAKEYGNGDFLSELRRVMAHGILHLFGFADKTEAEATEMRKAENEALEVMKNYVSRET